MTQQRSLKIKTVNLYTATTQNTINDEFIKTTVDGDFSLASNNSFLSFRKWIITVDGTEFEGYRFWLVTNPTSSSVTLNVSASDDAPAYTVSYNDAALNFVSCIGLLDDEDLLVEVFGGQGGTGANARHEAWVFLPSSEYDLSPLINDIEQRLNP